MKCEEAEKQMLRSEDGSYAPEVLAHLKGCASCRAFARMLVDAVPPRPGEALEQAVLMSAKAEMRRRRRRHAPWFHVCVAAAASVVLVLSIWVGRLLTVEPIGNGGKSGEIVETQNDSSELDDPLLDDWLVADKTIGDVEFNLTYADFSPSFGVADTDEVAAPQIIEPSVNEFSKVSEQLFNLESLLYDESN